MARMWHDDDVSLGPIKGETIAVIGYGIQGAAQASNLRDSGLKVVVGLREGGKSWAKAESEGHKVMTVPDAVKAADIVHILIPDMEQASIYKEDIKPNLQKGAALSFSHGAAIHWKWIVPPKQSDVIMVAPKSPGQRVRELYLENFGTPSLVAVEQDYSKRAWERILGMAKGIGSTRPGVLQTTFKEEVESDWFGEQVDLCGGVESMVKNAFETLVEAGYQPEIAYFETLHELKLIVDLVQKYGYRGDVSQGQRDRQVRRPDAGQARHRPGREEGHEEGPEGDPGRDLREGVGPSLREGGPKILPEVHGRAGSPPDREGGKKFRKMMWPNDQVT